MRDNRCKKEIVEKKLNSEIESVNNRFKHIKELQRYTEEEMPKEKVIRILNKRYRGIIDSELDIIRHKYTLGFELSELHKDYLVILEQVNKMENNLYNYLATSVVALGILFEEGIESFPKIINLLDKHKEYNLLFDYFINGCGLKRKFYSKGFAKKWFKFSTELIEIAQKDRVEASKRLVDYMNNQFEKDYWGKYWDDPITDEFIGFWMFEYAAIAKMFKLDDSELKDYPHYPYELAHYKDGMKFTTERMLDIPKEEVKTYKKGIPECPKLEKLVPLPFHEIINNLVIDFKTLSDKDFFEKYEMDDWCYQGLDWYIEHKDEPDIFGTVFIYLLIDSGYILQVDLSDEYEKVEVLKNFWGKRKVKAVNFNLGNDCYYFAYIPKSVKLKYIFDVGIEDVSEYEHFEQYLEYLEHLEQ